MELPAQLDPIDVRITSWMARHGIGLTRVSLGIVFLWFGALKFVPGWSPAAALATRTIERLTLGIVPPQAGLLVLAAWESMIGLGLLTGRWMRITLLLLFVQMAGTMLPLLFFPSETFLIPPIAPTLEGQYIVKNLVLIGAAVVLGATVRGGRLSASPGTQLRDRREDGPP
jgi:uncharacterized membrane protein YkgB